MQGCRKKGVHFRAPPKYSGPFQIIKRISPTAVRLSLPNSWKIHPTFHVSLVKMYVPSDETPKPPAPIVVDSEEHWEIEKIIATRRFRNKTQYLVKWLGFADHDNSWLYEHQLSNAQDLLRKWKLGDGHTVSDRTQ
ncbi:MAG: chromo domain-containing protein [Microbacteriaceae bacterium]|nr:chromo domain-containing protein [Microbacteriaceae bacterium]